MKRFFAIILLFGMFAMNADMICKSLCEGHGNAAHASHHNMTGHEMPSSALGGGDMCPVTHKAHHAMSHEAHNTIPGASIKCNCAADQEASIGYELAIAKPILDLKPHVYIISKIHSPEVIFLSREPVPSEGPPKILS